MPIYKDSRRKTWYYSFSHNGRRVRSKDYDNKKDAEKALAKALLSTDKIPEEALTFNQVAIVFLAEKKQRLKQMSYDRLETMLNHFLVSLGSVRIDRLTISQYQKALDALDAYRFNGKPLKNTYKNKVIKAFKQLCSFANKRYDLYTNVPAKFDLYRNEEKEEMHFITLQQFNQLLSVVDDPMYKALFITLFYMGFRIGEANALTWADVDFNNNTISVNKSVTTKLKDGSQQWLVTTPKTKSSVRTLPMPQIVSAALLALYDKFPYAHIDKASAFVFGTHKPIPESTLQNKKKAYFKAAGLEPIRLHDFRHSCASFLINNGATPVLVSKWLGHSSITMTLNVYSHLWSDALDDIVKVINAKT